MGVDLQEKRQLDLAGQMARVKAHARPWRAIIFFVLAVACAITADQAADSLFGTGPAAHGAWPAAVPARPVWIGASAAFAVCSMIATLSFAGKARDVLTPSTGSAHAGVVRYAVVLAGGLATLIITLDLFRVHIEQLLVGGALAGVLVGIAAQQSLSNIFAGMVLLLARPFAVGDSIRVRAGALGGQIEGTVTEVGITYVRLDTADGPVALPNASVLAAAVGPAKPASDPGESLQNPPGSPR